MRNLALEEARSGITANSIALGLMDNVDLDEGMLTAIARSVPVGRLGSPDDVGALCVYLASDEAAWMTGQTLELNGGSATS
jgi:NAD(P)-dependent dehydrogenase (short-subunit alcohol dehydrogenase family)